MLDGMNLIFSIHHKMRKFGKRVLVSCIPSCQYLAYNYRTRNRKTLQEVIESGHAGRFDTDRSWSLICQSVSQA